MCNMQHADMQVQNMQIELLLYVKLERKSAASYFFWRVVVTEVYDILGLKVDCGGGGGTPNDGIPGKSCWPFGGAPG